MLNSKIPPRPRGLHEYVVSVCAAAMLRKRSFLPSTADKSIYFSGMQSLRLAQIRKSIYLCPGHEDKGVSSRGG